MAVLSVIAVLKGRKTAVSLAWSQTCDVTVCHVTFDSVR